MTRSDRDEAAVKDLVRRHWNGRAATFDDESHHGVHGEEQRERWLSVLRERIGDEPLRALDVGCGTGFLSLLLAALGHDVTGVDVAPEMLDRARAKAGEAGLSIAFQRGDAEALAVTDDTCDLVVERHLLWTLPNPAAALREWRRVLRPGGRVVLIEGRWDHEEPWDEYREMHDDLPLYHGRSAGELSDRLSAAGFEAIEHEPLTDPVLWGREPRHDYYIMVGTAPR